MHLYWHVTIATASGGEIQAFDSSPFVTDTSHKKRPHRAAFLTVSVYRRFISINRLMAKKAKLGSIAPKIGGRP